MGGVILFPHLTVCDVHSFLRSREHDLFALLFLSDLIGHYPHHISDRCKCTHGKLNIISQCLKIEMSRLYSRAWNTLCSLALVGVIFLKSASQTTQKHELTARQRQIGRTTTEPQSLHIFLSLGCCTPSCDHLWPDKVMFRQPCQQIIMNLWLTFEDSAAVLTFTFTAAHV